MHPRRAGLVLLVWLSCAVVARAQSNGVLREVYFNIAGSAVSDLTNAPSFPNNPDLVTIESAFEAPSNIGDNYGTRMRALLAPPVTGNYVFWIATDDNGALYLSQDANPAHKVLIASESSWDGARQWNTHASQKSAPISLTAGNQYYIEALQKQGSGSDNIAVTWQKPGDPVPANGAPPIPGTYLVPYGLGPPVILVQPASVSVIEGGSASFTVQVGQKYEAVYQWRRNGVPITGATNTSWAIGPVSVSDNGSRFSCSITNSLGSTNSAAATLTVNPDVTRPLLASVGSPGNPQVLSVIFSKPVEPASATSAANYRISSGVSVLSAAFGPDPRMVLLTTSPMAVQTNYTLTVSNVRDRAATPNVILPNSTFAFTLAPNPLDFSLVRPAAEPPGPPPATRPLSSPRSCTTRPTGRAARPSSISNSTTRTRISRTSAGSS